LFQSVTFCKSQVSPLVPAVQSRTPLSPVPAFRKIKAEHSPTADGDATACCRAAWPACTMPSGCRELQHLLPPEQTSDQEQTKGHRLSISGISHSVQLKTQCCAQKQTGIWELVLFLNSDVKVWQNLVRLLNACIFKRINFSN